MTHFFPAMCDPLGSFANGQITYNRPTFRDTGRYAWVTHAIHSCNEGYTLTGYPTKVCTNYQGRWELYNRQPPVCVPGKDMDVT